MYVEEGGTATFTSLCASNAKMYLDGYTSQITVSQGSLTVYDKGIAESLLLSGSAVVSGGTVNKTTIYNGGMMTVYSKGVVSSTTIRKGGSLLVAGDEATASSTTVQSGGSFCVYGSKARAESSFIQSGYMQVFLGAKVHSTEISKGGLLEVSSGVAEETIVKSDGRLIIISGGSATGTTVNKGGTMDIIAEAGKASNTVVLEGGAVNIASQGKANDITVSQGGRLNVADGGEAETVSLKGGDLEVTSGGSADGIKIEANGCLVVSADGRANDANIKEGRLNVYEQGEVYDSIITGGSMFVFKGGNAGYIKINSGAMYVSSGGSASYIDVAQGGYLSILDEYVTVKKIKEEGGYVDIKNSLEGCFTTNTFSDITVLRASATVHSGTTAVNTTLKTLGSMVVFSGGQASGTVVSSGGLLYVSQGGSAINTTAYGRLEVEGLAMGNTVFSGGELTVNGINNDDRFVYDQTFNYLSACASDSIIDGGNLLLCYGGIAEKTTLRANGILTVSSDCTADATTIDSKGILKISQGGKAWNTILNSGSAVVFDGGKALANTINGGQMIVSSGGGTYETTVNSGGSLLILEGGVHSGTLQIENGALVSASQGGIIDFTVYMRFDCSTALVNDWSRIKGGNLASYTLTVDSMQDYGTYVLADGAAAFNQNITVMALDGATMSKASNGTVSLDQTLKCIEEKKKYSLHLEDSSLILEISELHGDPLRFLRGSLDSLSWEAQEVPGYVVEYSKDDFKHVLSVNTTKNGLNTLELANGNYEWRARAVDSEIWKQGNGFSVNQQASNQPRVISAPANGKDVLFFAKANGIWDDSFVAQHVGSLEGWTGTNQCVELDGKNKFNNLYQGSTDFSILVLTDDDNGDAICLDDIFSEMPDGLDAQARISMIDEIRAGAGNDLLDLTSQRFAYVGNGMTVHGGLGDDTIWANKGVNRLFGDAGNDSIVGGSDNDIIAGGSGDDYLHGGGGNDIFCFGGNWGQDTVEQLADGKVTLWFDEGSLKNWDRKNLVYSDGDNSVTLKGVTADKVSLVFGNANEQYGELVALGAFNDFTSEKIYEDGARMGYLA